MDNFCIKFQAIFCFRLSLEVMTLNPTCENVETAQGVPLTVTGVAQVFVYNFVIFYLVYCM